MSYGNSGWSEWVLEEEESMKHFEAAWKMGINTWDTANVYSGGDSERLVGKAIKKFNIPRDEIVILTKVFMNVGKDPRAHPSTMKDLDNTGYVNLHGLSRKHIFDSIKASLERMDLEYVDVLQCHRFDPETPIEETMDALHDVVKAGLARYIGEFVVLVGPKVSAYRPLDSGMSSCYAYQFNAMQTYAKSKGQTAFISMQPFYNAICFGVGAIPWSPLARGYLTRPFSEQNATKRSATDPNFGKFVGLGNKVEEEPLQAINAAIEKIAKARGYSMAQIALAWTLANSTVSAPIIGSTKIESLEELVKATHIELTPEEIKAISEPYRPRGILGHA
ncbi:hypothetical protein P7C70_g5245, partial [Phenoliferia sp. Uapishka_3]